MADETDFKAQDFVYIGLRMGKDGLYASIITLNPDGTEDRPWSFDLGKKRREWDRRVVGAIYRGAQFNATHVRGLYDVSFQRMLPDEQKRLDYRSRNDAAEAEDRTARIEKDIGRVSDIERQMLELRKLYAAYAKKYDNIGMRALQAAVLSALQTAPRKSELED